MSSEFVFSAQDDPTLNHTKKPPDLKLSPPKPSFRDKLLGSSQEIPTRERENMIEKNLVRIELEDGNRLLPKVYLEPTVFQELCTPWKDALVVKLLGKTLGYNTMRDRLHRIWKLQGGFEIMDNDNGFYMVKFDQAADKEKVVTGGPWLIYDHCLAVTHWSPEFASPNAKVERTVVWVRFPGLNLVYYDESFLLAMASAIGRPVKVDTNTLKVERGKFARVCVEIDLTLPVVGKIWVNGHWYKIQYEGLHLICTNCGCYGHLGRNCTTPPRTAPPEKPQQQTAGNQQEVSQPLQHINQTIDQSQLMPESSNGKAVNFVPNDLSVIKGNIISIDEGNKELHGDWLLVTRKKKSTSNPTLISSKPVTNKTNRFTPLTSVTQNNRPAPLNQKFPPRPNPNDITRANKPTNDPKRRRQEENNFDPLMEYSFASPTINTKPKPVKDSSKKHAIPTHVVKSNYRTNNNLETSIPSPHKLDQSVTFEPNFGNVTILTPTHLNPPAITDPHTSPTASHDHVTSEDTTDDYIASMKNKDDLGVRDEDMVT
jgi:hypothetical protein